MAALHFGLIKKALSAPKAKIFIAYSGGVDSHVLLHLCATHYPPTKITAVYIHHGLQLQADAWAEHCQKTAQQLGVNFESHRVNARNQPGQSPEEVARQARYSALQSLLAENDVLLTAQHREDQLETVLLQLFRGAGVQGLAAMPVSMPLGKGVMVRPFLDVEKKSILEYAEKESLMWVEDPSNQLDDYPRNFLRNQIIPQLKQRWPGLDKTVARSARHCATAAQILADQSTNGLNACYDGEEQSLKIAELKKLSPGRQNLILRQWLIKLGLMLPSEKHLQIIVNEIIAAGNDANPELSIQQHLIKRFQGRLFCIDVKELIREAVQVWPKHCVSIDRANGYELRIVDAEAGIPVRIWRKAKVDIRLRMGGEAISLPGRSGHHLLKKLFQEAAIPPWKRQVIPLIYLDDCLAAVAGFWISAELYCDTGEPCYQLFWDRKSSS